MCCPSSLGQCTVMEMKFTQLKFIADQSFYMTEDMARLLGQPQVKQDLD